MTSYNKKSTREYSIPDKLRGWKIERIATVGNNLLVRYDGNPITSRIGLDDLAGSMKRFRKEAEKKIFDNGVAASDIIDELQLHITNESIEHFESGRTVGGNGGAGNGHSAGVGNVRYIGGHASANKILKMAPKAMRGNCTFDEWSSELQKKYNALKKIVDEKLPGLWLPLEFTISVRCILNIKNISLPFIGIILGETYHVAFLFAKYCVQTSMSKGERDKKYMPSTMKGSIQVKFVCKECRDGRHGCAGAWRGLGLKIFCSCDCIKQACEKRAPSPTDSTRKEVAKA